MARQIKRISVTAIALLMVGLFYVLPMRHAQSTEGDAPPPDQATVEQAMVLRAALGVGPNDLLIAAASAADDTAHQAIITKGIAFLNANHEQLTPLITAYQQASDQVVQLLSKGEPTDDAFAQMDSARDALLTAAQGLFDEVDADIPPAYQTVLTRLIESSGLDTDLRPLNLTTPQRAALLAATRQRDTLLLDARNWYQDEVNETAKAQYETAVNAMLTEPLRTQRTNFQQLMTAHMEAVTMAEVAMMGG
ncbi:MAG: hypothetical protein HJJLKODD_02916 [Phycisphaerae bacterium]|nr:hypothetical protein [Phycisphaerae bacterium]